jgi:sugar/nucleoside kinase (ribokinase family)
MTTLASSFPLVVVGTVAIDSLETPFGKRDRVFGGSASYFSYASSFFTPVALVANVGQDFPAEYRSVLEERPIDLSHLEVTEGKTFFWKGKYGTDLNSAITLETQLNVLTKFAPKLRFSTPPEFLFLANIDPSLQSEVLDQLSKPRLKFVACDTMNYWIQNKKKELVHLISRVDGMVMNDGEARQLTGEGNLIRAAQKVKAMGPRAVVIKKGEHGALVFFDSQFFAVPAYPLEEVFDPTGAGDTFAGGMMGYLASAGDVHFENLKKAVVMGSMMASFTVEDFGLDRLRRLTMPEIQERLEIFRKICTFGEHSE